MKMTIISGKNFAAFGIQLDRESLKKIKGGVDINADLGCVELCVPLGSTNCQKLCAKADANIELPDVTKLLPALQL
jgi:hypothetical protein